MITYRCIKAALLLGLVCTSIGRAEEPAFTGPPMLTFGELLRLAVDEEPPPGLNDKLQRLLSEPFISKEARLSGTRPAKPTNKTIGPLLRIAEWNIARGVNEPDIQMSLSRSEDFLQAARANGRHNAAKLVLGGDLNTNNHDGTPTSVRREFLKRILNYHFWLRKAVYFIVPVPFPGVISASINYVKNYHDPTALNFHVIALNHEKPLFNAARNFRFTDGGAFDFGGRKSRTFQHKGRTLAESNQRAWKGFTPTFVFQRTFLHLVGSYKLDWFFVKPSELAFSPYYGRTLQSVNTALAKRLSDHAPITVDLPLGPALTHVRRSRRTE